MEGADGERTEEELVAQGRSFPSFFFLISLTPRGGKSKPMEGELDWKKKKNRS